MTGYRLTPQAKRHIAEILHYSIDAWGERRAVAYVREIAATMEAVTRNERQIRRCDQFGAGMRSVASGSHNIYLRYDAASDMYEVIGVLHQSMDPPRHLTANDEQEPS